MIVPIPFGSRHSATAEVPVWIPVRCKFCSATFAYRTVKTGSGEGASLLWLDEKGAAQRAQEKAVTSLRLDPKVAYAAVPCPRCERYQPGMVRMLRRGRIKPGLFVGAVFAFFWFISVADTPGGYSPRTAFTGTSGGSAAIAVAAVVIGFILAVALKPKAHARAHSSQYPRLLVTSAQFGEIAAGFVKPHW